jgi:plastocyanin
MIRIPHLRTAAAAGVLVLTIAFGACGGSKSDSGTAAKAGASPTTAASGSATADASASGDAVQIKDFAFHPDKLTVKVGTEVTWTNDDTFAHTVTADDKSFDSKNIDPKGTFKQKFEKAGTYKYICNIHNSMMATVTVQ